MTNFRKFYKEYWLKFGCKEKCEKCEIEHCYKVILPKYEDKYEIQDFKIERLAHLMSVKLKCENCNLKDYCEYGKTHCEKKISNWLKKTATNKNLIID